MGKTLGIGLILIGLGIVFFVLYSNSKFSSTTRPFSPYEVLDSSWEKYKAQFLNKDGRIIDYSQNADTTSEGQSYALLRSAWMDDKSSFDLVWKWTDENLKRSGDYLFGWQWGKRTDGSYGLLSNGGENSATDADSDIAFALILAYKRWNDQSYLASAKNILTSIWNIETVTEDGKRYLIAGNWAKAQSEIVVNPSYLSPFEYRVFGKIDTSHNWNSLVDSSYSLLSESTKANLDKEKSANLPPDWIAVTSDGKIRATNLPNLDTNYSYDSVRVPWRIALDYMWNKDPRAKSYLNGNFQILAQIYQNTDKLPSGFSHDGVPLSGNEDPTMYATSLGYFMIVHPDLAQSIYQNKILNLYSNGTDSFNSNLPYYDQNWLWFGVAIYNNLLPPLNK